MRVSRVVMTRQGSCCRSQNRNKNENSAPHVLLVFLPPGTPQRNDTPSEHRLVDISCELLPGLGQDQEVASSGEQEEML